MNKFNLNNYIKEAKSKEPKFETLEENKVKLTDEERKQVMDAGAVWHYTGKPTPAVWKANVDGKDWYICNTHRYYECKPTLKGAINSYDYVETTSSSDSKLKKIAYRKRIKDRGINWKETYHERSKKLKDRFEKEIGPDSYKRWEGHDYTTHSDYFIVVGPAVDKNFKKRFFAGIKKLPDDPKAKVYAPSGEYFSNISSAYTHASDKWGVTFPRGVQNYSVADLAGIKIPRHVKGDVSIYNIEKTAKEDEKWNPNPWAICHSKIDKDKEPEKFERCVQDVKKKQKDNNS